MDLLVDEGDLGTDRINTGVGVVIFYPECDGHDQDGEGDSCIHSDCDEDDPLLLVELDLISAGRIEGYVLLLNLRHI